MYYNTSISSNSVETNYFFNNKTFYTVNFKDNTYAFVLKDTLLDIMKVRMKDIESIVKFSYDKTLNIHNELVLFAQHMKLYGSEYIKTYQNLNEMYSSNPLDECDLKIIMRMNDENN